MAKRRAMAGVRWVMADHLGTPRISVDQTGALSSVTRHDYLPFGEELQAGSWGRTSAQGYAGDSVKQKYTGYERDAETNLNYAEARYHSDVQGRFTSVDPLQASAKLTDPSTVTHSSSPLQQFLLTQHANETMNTLCERCIFYSRLSAQECIVYLDSSSSQSNHQSRRRRA
jgi:RHS repeat-associated protein